MFKIFIENKEIRPINDVQAKKLNSFLNKISDKGHIFNLYLEEDRNTITDKQKALYSAIVTRISEDTGSDFSEVDTHFKKFLPKEFKGTALDNSEELYTLSFESLMQYEFEIFLNEVLREAKEFFGINMQLDYINNITRIIIK
jgi:hypothetical protein